MQTWQAVISKGGRKVHINGTGGWTGAALNARTIKGWYSTPQPKVKLTERESSDGAHDIEPNAVLYSARTVTLELYAEGSDRSEVQEAINNLLAMAHGLVKLRVKDDNHDTYVEGYLSVDVKADKATRNREEVTVTIVCPRPERLSEAFSVAFMIPSVKGYGGLQYSHVGVLTFPLSYGVAAERVTSICTITNHGTATAYPVITAMGNLPFGFTVTNSATGEQLGYSDGVSSAPVILDSRTRTASVNGVDVTRNVYLREFPVVGAGETVTLSLEAAGTGTIEVNLRDTFI